MCSLIRRVFVLGGGAGSLLLGLLATASASTVFAAGERESFIVVYKSQAQVDRQRLAAQGDVIESDLGDAKVLVVRSTNAARLAAQPGVAGVAKDLPIFSVPEEAPTSVIRSDAAGGAGCASAQAACPLQWDLARIHVPDAWGTTQGSPSVRVAVLDTGLTSFHEEVGANYDKADSRSFVQANTFCAADNSTFNSLEDLQGHGTWTATHVAGVDGARMTGIAPRATLLNVRVLGACGRGAFSWVINGMRYASLAGARVESMSLGGYLCADGFVPGSFFCGNPNSPAVQGGPALWQAFIDVVEFAREQGTVIVAAAGNDHVHLDVNGRVATDGSLAFRVVGRADPANDARGLAEAPGGVPGVVAVGALTRVTAEGDEGETRFGQYGVGNRDQLTYYSSFGERINASAPGGARNFNVPTFDCLTAECRRLDPSSADATDNSGDFGAWGVDPVTGVQCGNCYINVQGTSMATPQVAGVAVLALAVNPDLGPDDLKDLLSRAVSGFTNPNATPAAASDPARPTYNWDIDYGAPGVPNILMGPGVIDAAIAVRLAAGS